jgi:hypothetical protein
MAGVVSGQERPSAVRPAPVLSFPTQSAPRLALAPGQVPGVQSISVETGPEGGKALLQVRVAPGAGLPAAFDYPYEDGTVAVNDQGRQGDRKAGDRIYSAQIPFDLRRFRARIAANFALMERSKLAAPPALSARFDRVASSKRPPPGAKPAPVRPDPVLAAADRQFRETALRDARTAIAVLNGPLTRQTEIFRAERFRGGIRAFLFGRLVLSDVLVPATVLPADVVPDRSLMITDAAVVKDPARTFDPCGSAGNPDGKWTFKHLVTQMANTPETGITPEEFVWNWLTLSDFTQEDNSFLAPARSGYVAFIRDQWLAASGGVTLDLDEAPFRLLAIVSRSDLAGNPGGYSGGSAGEARFVFGVVNPANPCGSPPRSTVIFEYGIKKPSCSSIKAWIKSWFDLSASGLVLGGSFNTALEALTEQFVTIGADPTQLPNRNTISQIRTNDLIGGPWTLYEYKLRPTGMANAGNLDLVTVKQNPDISYKQMSSRVAKLGAYIALNQIDIANNDYVVPASFQGQPFLGAESPTFNDTSFTWTNTPFPSAPDPTALLNFSRGTCNGCHTGDTNTVFTHIDPRSAAGVSNLSLFLSNPDPNVVDDLERRQAAMAGALNAPCHFMPMFRLQIGFVH